MSSEKHLFRPDMVHKQPALLEAERKSEAAGERFCREGLAVINELLELVGHMPIASRFNRTTDLEEMTGRLGANPLLNATAGAAIEQEGEAGFKRIRLQTDLKDVQNRLLELTGRLQRILKLPKQSNTNPAQLY